MEARTGYPLNDLNAYKKDFSIMSPDMLLITVCLGIAALIGFIIFFAPDDERKTRYNHKTKKMEKEPLEPASIVVGAAISFGVGLVFAFFIALIWLFFWSMQTGVEKLDAVETSSLKVIDSKDITQGSFFLGSGTIDSVPYIQFVSKSDKGEIRIERVPVKEAVIYENNDVTPNITRTTYRTEVDKGIFGVNVWHNSRKTVEFTIPEDTIQTDFDILNQSK